MITDKIGSKVVVLTEQGAYIGGTFWSSSPGGSLFVMKDEICLDVEFASQPQSWEILPHREAWRGKGKIVEDPREG